MTVLLNSLEGGTSGTTLTQGSGGNTGGIVSGSFLDVINIGTSATVAFDSTHAAHGTLSCKIATSGTAATAYTQWSTSMGSLATVWFRLYLFITANPANVLRLFSALQTSTSVGAIALTTTGLLRQLNSTGATIQTGAVAVPANQWVRVEGFLTGDPSAGQIEHKLFKSMDSTTPDEVLTSAATQAMTGPPNVYRLGFATSVASATYWLDDIGLSSASYMGPAAASGSGGIIIPKIALSGAGTGAAFGGTGAVAAPKVSLAASGGELFTGTGAVPSAPAAAFPLVLATQAPTTKWKIALSGSGTETFAGTGAIAAPRIALSGTDALLPKTAVITVSQPTPAAVGIAPAGV